MDNHRYDALTFELAEVREICAHVEKRLTAQDSYHQEHSLAFITKAIEKLERVKRKVDREIEKRHDRLKASAATEAK